MLQFLKCRQQFPYRFAAVKSPNTNDIAQAARNW